MATRTIPIGILLTGIIALSGCAHGGRDASKRIAPAATTTNAMPAQQGTAPATGPVADDLHAIAQRLLSHPRRVYLSAEGAYDFYMGGTLDARYQPDSGILFIVADDGSAAPLTCKYSPEDKLFLNNDTAATETACKQLRDRLREGLTR